MVHCLEKKLTETYNLVRQPLPMGEVLESCVRVSDKGTTLTWVSADVLTKHTLRPWQELPMWADSESPLSGSLTWSAAKALGAGLTIRPIDETVKDTLDWFERLPEKRRATLRAGTGRQLIERLPYHLCKFFWKHSSEGRSLALITVLSTEGSTYSKAGSQMLVNDEGNFQGMLSGGCLEGDLAEHSKLVITSGVAEVITYDLRADDDVFGLGVGCEGALRILIQPLNADAKYEPFASLIAELKHASHAEAPLRLLILGAGQDADPLVTFAVALGWEVAVSDHRPAAIERLGDSGAASVQCIPTKDIASHFDLGKFDAVIVMSHNLEADRTYLATLADAPVDFIGLLGPPHRRDRLLREIGSAADKLRGRLRGPVGKQIGGRGPAAIALEIAAELQSYFSSDRQS